jgi:hypothetical protein
VSTLFCSTSSAAWYWSCIFCTHTGGRFSYIVAPQQHSQAASLACVTTAAFTSSLIGMCHHSSIHKQPHWYVSPQQHPQAASLVCVTTAPFTSSLIGMCHHSSIHKQPHWHVSPQQHSAPYLVPGILLQGGVIGLAKSRWGWGRGLWWRQVQVTHWHVLGLAGRVGTSSQQLPHLLIAGLHQDEGL